MLKRFYILLWIVIIFPHTGLYAQSINRYNTFSYSVNEGLLQSTLGDMAVDKNNFCWLSFPNGIQKFDGRNFISVPVQPGLPDDKLAGFYQCRNGDLLVRHPKGISRYDINRDRFILVYNNAPSIKEAVQCIGEDEEIIYFLTEAATIVRLDRNTYQFISETKTGLPNYSINTDYRPKISDNIIDHKVVFNIKSILYLWDLKANKLISQSESLENVSTYMLRMKSGHEVLYFTYSINNALLIYNFNTSSKHVQTIKGKDSSHISRCIIFPWQNRTLVSFSNKLFECDPGLEALSSELVNFQNNPVAGSSSIAAIRQDHFGNLFLQTITGGIRKVIRNNYPIRYYGSISQENDFIMSILPDKKNNRVLAGTFGNGLMVFDTLQRLVKHIRHLPGQADPFNLYTVIKAANGDYILYIGGEKSIWRLSSDLSRFTRFAFSTTVPEPGSGIQFFTTLLHQDDEQAIVQSQSMMYRTFFAGTKTSEQEVTRSYTMSGIALESSILTHANDELVYLDKANFKEIKRVPLRNTGHVRCFAKQSGSAGGGMIYVGSNNGIFIIDSNGKVLEHLTRLNGLPDNCVYAMIFDGEGLLWCSTNKGVFRLNRDNSILLLRKEDGLQDNEFNTNVVARSDDGEIFFGGVNGISSFYPAAIGSFEENIDLLFTSIKANNEDVIQDSAAWNIPEIRLPYTRNALAFDFITKANNNPDQYIYQYKMDGVDKDWIQNHGMQTVRYSLPPGRYTFKIAASRFFDKDAIAMRTVEIVIRPPFWKTWWFLGGIALLIVGIIAYATNQYSRKRYQKKLVELESDFKVRLERERISRDLHDSIGAYANAVLYSTELLEKEEEALPKAELMKDLKYASKDIITSLRETVWALKKDNYTPEECLLRIRNFIQSLSRIYLNIQFKVEGEASSGEKLHYARALNVVRIMQEAVTNAIKHSGTRHISISSSEQDGKWELKITDDGNGFARNELNGNDPGMGLENMKKRANDSGFGFDIQSRPGSGTSVIILV